MRAGDVSEGKYYSSFFVLFLGRLLILNVEPRLQTQDCFFLTLCHCMHTAPIIELAMSAVGRYNV